MAITVKNNNKMVINSGNINVLYDKDPVAEFDVEGLQTKLIFDLLPVNSEKKTSIVFGGEEDSAFFKHSIKLSTEKSAIESGMLVPLEFAVRENGESLYITWSAKLKHSADKERIIQVAYAFYEDFREGEEEGDGND